MGYWKSRHADASSNAHVTMLCKPTSIKPSAEIRQLKDERFGKQSETPVPHLDRSNQLVCDACLINAFQQTFEKLNAASATRDDHAPKQIATTRSLFPDEPAKKPVDVPQRSKGL